MKQLNGTPGHEYSGDTVGGKPAAGPLPACLNGAAPTTQALQCLKDAVASGIRSLAIDGRYDKTDGNALEMDVPPLEPLSLVVTRPRAEALVDDILFEKSLAVLYAAENIGKSFLAVDLAMSIGSGLPALGRRVRHGKVVYVVGEGTIASRARAWLKYRGVAPESVSMVIAERNINIGNRAVLRKTADSIIESDGELPCLVIFDTLASCIPGVEENNAKEMGRVITNLREFQSRLNCTVLLIHHTAKGSMKARGSGALAAAADTMLQLSGNPDSIRLTVTKQKEVARVENLGLRLVEVQVSADDSSCVIVPADVHSPGGQYDPVKLRVLQSRADSPDAPWSELASQVGVSPTTMYRHRDALERAGYLSDGAVTAAGRALLGGVSE